MDKRIEKILKWAGILALLSLPVFVFSKRKKTRTEPGVVEDDGNIFADELNEKRSKAS